MDEDGYVWYAGRADDVIIAAGYRIGPFEVESACIEHPAVREAAAVASPDEVKGNVVKAFIVLAEGHEPSDELADEIKGFVRDRLSAYAYPRKVEFVDELPKTLTGKIRRIELREPARARAHRLRRGTPPRRRWRRSTRASLDRARPRPARQGRHLPPTFTATPEAATLTRAGHMTGETVAVAPRLSRRFPQSQRFRPRPDIHGMAATPFTWKPRDLHVLEVLGVSLEENSG